MAAVTTPPPQSLVRRHPFARKVAWAMRHRCGVRPARRDPGPLLLAVSGGADSVALLRAMAALAPMRGWGLRLVVGHVDHGVRAESKDDARFVAELTERLLGPGRFTLHTLDPTELRGNHEAALRALRYAALAEAARRCAARSVVTAHHADDQLETVLMRVMRGAGARGLAGMAWRSRIPSDRGTLRLLRPMLAVTHDEAIAFLRDIDQPWREDATNRDATRWRARLRRDVLPVLREMRPGVAGKAVQLGDHLRGAHRVLRQQAAALEARAASGPQTLNRDALRSADPEAVATLLRRWLVRTGARRDALSRSRMDPVIAAIRDKHSERRVFSFRGDPDPITVEVGPAAVVVKRQIQ